MSFKNLSYTICHRQPSRSIMLQFKVLIWKVFAIDWETASSVSTSEVSSYEWKLFVLSCCWFCIQSLSCIYRVVRHSTHNMNSHFINESAQQITQSDLVTRMRLVWRKCRSYTLKHEVLNDTVKFRSFVSIADSFVLSELFEVFNSFWHDSAEQADFNDATRFASDLDVEEDLFCAKERRW